MQSLKSKQWTLIKVHATPIADKNKNAMLRCSTCNTVMGLCVTWLIIKLSLSQSSFHYKAVRSVAYTLNLIHNQTILNTRLPLRFDGKISQARAEASLFLALGWCRALTPWNRGIAFLHNFPPTCTTFTSEANSLAHLSQSAYSLTFLADNLETFSSCSPCKDAATGDKSGVTVTGLSLPQISCKHNSLSNLHEPQSSIFTQED